MKDYHFFSVTMSLLVATFLTVVVKPAFSEESRSFHFADTAMGTIVRFTLVTENGQLAGRAAQKAFAAVHFLSRELSHRDSDGSIGAVNRAAGVEPVTVPVEVYGFIERGLAFSARTGGLFDISIGAVTTVAKGASALSVTAIKERKKLVDYRLVQLDEDSGEVFLPIKGMSLDLGGIAKGMIIDKAVQILKAEGIAAGIVEAGGDLFCFGDKDWRVGVQHPRKPGLLGVIVVRDQAVCGSGDYYQYVIDENSQERLHHIIDPAKMKSAGKSISVTVMAPTAELADGLATTLFIMGSDQGNLFMEKEFPDCAALWVNPDSEIVKSVDFLWYQLVQ